MSGKGQARNKQYNSEYKGYGKGWQDNYKGPAGENYKGWGQQSPKAAWGKGVHAFEITDDHEYDTLTFGQISPQTLAHDIFVCKTLGQGPGEQVPRTGVGPHVHVERRAPVVRICSNMADYTRVCSTWVAVCR